MLLHSAFCTGQYPLIPLGLRTAASPFLTTVHPTTFRSILHLIQLRCSIMSLERKSLRAELESTGYVVVPDLIPPSLVQALNDACLRVIERTRNGNWPHRRIVGKQFPPFEGDETDVWGVQHLMHPELREPVFAEWYGSECLREVCCELLDCQPDDLQMGMRLL